jgi:hypothetical protein
VLSGLTARNFRLSRQQYQQSGSQFAAQLEQSRQQFTEQLELSRKAAQDSAEAERRTLELTEQGQATLDITLPLDDPSGPQLPPEAADPG